ncbi:MAG: hypothetical protein AB7P17_02430 [Nitrospirales bacterium]
MIIRLPRFTSNCFWWFRTGLVILGSLLTVPCLGAQSEMEMYVPDVLSSPGKEIILQARLIEALPEGHAGISEKTLDFSVQGKLVGHAKTNEDGWAKLTFTPKMRGNLQLVVKGAPESHLPPIQGKGTLLSWERRRPIILVDLAALVEGAMVPDEQVMPFPMPGLLLGDAQSGASHELGKLAEFYYNVIYLDRTGRGKIDTIQVWLRKQGFPPGMIRILSNEPSGLAELLETLKAEGWENVSAGIGQTADFADVLVQHRVQTVIIQKLETSEKFPRRAIVLKDWTRVRRHL